MIVTNIIIVIEYLYVSTKLYNIIKGLINFLEVPPKSFNIMWILKNRRKYQKFKGNIRLNINTYTLIKN